MVNFFLSTNAKSLKLALKKLFCGYVIFHRRIIKNHTKEKMSLKTLIILNPSKKFTLLPNINRIWW